VHLKKYFLLKYLLIGPIVYFLFWAAYEVAILQSLTYNNWIIVILLLIVEVAVIQWERKNKKLFEANIKRSDVNPWLSPQKDSSDEDSFGNFLKKGAGSLGAKSEGAMNAFRRSRFHVKVFFKIKRVCYGVLFLFYVAMALTSLTNPIFLVLFLITAYAFLENLLWVRHYQWSKRKKQNETQEQ